ncbi:MAG: hypothetical protein H0W96_01865 [Solirubrobacterales bacterium]|nr:hypothetical protein [Solirubrobacterales bacterium]
MEMTADPAAMREQAALVRSAAEAIGTTTDRLQNDIESLVFEGPAAERFREASRERISHARQLTGELQSLAERMLNEAHTTDGHGASGLGPH